MIPTRPKVEPNGWYSRVKTANALGISPSTLDNYTQKGFIRYELNRYNMRKLYKGEEIIKFWNKKLFSRR